MIPRMADALFSHVFGPADAPPLLALHGVTGHGGRFRGLAERDLPGFRVVAPDLRGHGRSPRLPPWTLEQHAADVLAVLDAHGVESAPVVAHSYGGLVALRLPRSRVQRLALLDPAVSVRPPDALEWAESAGKVCADRAAAVAAQRHDWPQASDELVEEEVAANWVAAGGAWRPRYSPAAVATSWSEMCRPVPVPAVPTLLVRALRETYVGPEFTRASSAALGVDFTQVDLDCGHMVHLDEPDRVGALVAEFTGVGRGRGTA